VEDEDDVPDMEDVEAEDPTQPMDKKNINEDEDEDMDILDKHNNFYNGVIPWSPPQNR
jgi:hypothetical protein